MRVKILLHIMFFVFTGICSMAQESQNPLDKKIGFLYDLSMINIDEALSETKKLIDQYQNDPSNQARLYLLLMEFNSGKGNLAEAMENYKIGRRLAETHNENLGIRFQVVMADCYVDNYQYDEALQLYEEILASADIKKSKVIFVSTKLGFADLNNKINKERESLNILLEILKDSVSLSLNELLKANTILKTANLYNSLGIKDSTLYYLKYYEENMALKVPEIFNSYKLQVEANVLFSQGKYGEAIEKYRTYLVENEAFFNNYDVEIGLKKGAAFFEINQYDSVLTNLSKIEEEKDFEKKLSQRSLGDYYKLYSDVYGELGKKTLSDSYFKKYVSARQDYDESKFRTQAGLYEIKTKEILAEGEQTEKKYQSYIIYISSILGFLLLAAILFYIIKTKRDKKHFDELMATVQIYEQKKQAGNTSEKASIVEELPHNIEKEKEDTKSEIRKEPLTETPNRMEESEDLSESVGISETDGNSSSDTSPIKDEKIQELLEKLEKLKESGYFLRQDSSLYNTAKRLKTNTSYLSSVINKTMNTNFNRFVNDIRMDYVIIELKNNKRMRSYSVKGIAEEIGYKSADSFTKYFKESTGLSPSAFVRNLNKEYQI